MKTLGLTALAGAALALMACSPSNPTVYQSSAVASGASAPTSSAQTVQIAPSGSGASVAHPGGPPAASSSSGGYNSHSHWRRHHHSTTDGERG